jgi:diguanylate cyclase (GGDEF)-like protein/PAS domain S-box-containing protein
MNLPRLHPWIVAVALLLIGVTGMTGWLTSHLGLVQWQPTFAGMVFNTALCFAAIGIVFFLSTPLSRRRRALREAIAGAVILLALLVLAQYVFDIDLGIDWYTEHAWLDDGHPAPGRMAVGACFAFILSGTAFILLARKPSRVQAVAIHLCTLGVLLTGVIGLVGYSLRIDLIYPGLRWPRMSVQESLGVMLIAAGMWALWYRLPCRARYPFREDEKIAFIGAVILTTISLTIGMVGVSVQVATLQQSLSDRLLPMLENRYTLIRSSLQYGTERAESIVRHTSITHLTTQLIAHPGSTEALAQMKQVGQQILRSDFTGAVLVDVDGRQLWSVGHIIAHPAVHADIESGTSSLLWDDGYYLDVRVRLYEDSVWIGTLLVEQPVQQLTQSFFNVKHIGETGELGMCVDDSLPKLSCFPESRNQQPYGAMRSGPDGKLTAMSRAVAGIDGTFEGFDYRGHMIVAAYRSLAPGLGIAVKQDTAELFAPIRREMMWVLPLLALFIGLGALALGWMVKPIAKRLLQSEKEAKEREEQTRAVLDNIAEGIITLDEDGTILSFSGGASAIFGYRPEEVIGANIQILRPSGMRMRREANIRRYLQSAAQRKTSELPAQRKDGSRFLMEFAINELLLDERRLHVVIVRDITERKEAEEALFTEKERLHVTLSSIGDAVITTDTEGRVTYLNPVAEEMTGWTNSFALGRKLDDVFFIVEEQTGEPAANPVESVIRREMPLERPECTVLVRSDGMRFSIEDTASPIRDRDGKALGVVLVFHDVTQARKMAVQLRYQATHDGLTGLINRTELERRLQHLLNSERAENRQHSLLFLDLDRFKVVNDTCGHVAGDELLRQLSNLLRNSLRQSDTMARLGGDEFAVLLDCCAAAPALDVAESLRRIVSDFRFVWQEKTFPVGVSIGAVTFDEGNATVADVFRMADAACYVAKDKGRNRIQAYSPDDDMLARLHGEVGWLDRIRKALDEDRFVLYAQRIAPLRQGSAVEEHDHFELLLRMVEDGKVVPPMAFIPAAERYGLMPAVDRWVIRNAFSSYMKRAALGHSQGTFAINLSGASISDEHFLEFVLTQFAQHNVPPQTVCFEITETSAIANLNHAAALIQKLKAIGCRFSLDDFGSGMSSFAYLKHLPVDFLKIDGSFVKDMVEDPIDLAMVQSINNIGHVMGIQTIAEFVENDAILDALRKVGVDFAQGYGVAKPVPLESIALEPVR